MEDRSSSPLSDEHEIWSAIRRFRAIFFAIGLGGVAASAGLTAAVSPFGSWVMVADVWNMPF